MKKFFAAPQLEMIMLEDADILTTSDTDTMGGDGYSNSDTEDEFHT